MRVFAILLVGLIAISAFAIERTDPAFTYLAQHTAQPSGQLFEGEPWVGRVASGPPGGYLFRFTVPMGPDGTAVVFVTSSIYAERQQTSWDAFILSANGYFVPLARDVEFAEPSVPSLYLRVAETGKNPVLSEVALQRNEYSILQYTIESDNNLVLSRVPAGTRQIPNSETDNEESAIVAKLGLGAAFQPRVEKILLAEFLANPDNPWRPLAPSMDLNSQTLDPADGSALEQIGTFDQSAAREKWKRLDREVSASQPELKSSPSNQVDSKSAPATSISRGSNVAWLAYALGAVIILVAVGWFSRKRGSGGG